MGGGYKNNGDNLLTNSKKASNDSPDLIGVKVDLSFMRKYLFKRRNTIVKWRQQKLFEKNIIG